MKILVLLFTIIFSYSVLADCCNDVNLDVDCQDTVEKVQDSSHDERPHPENGTCHCPTSCLVKIIKIEKVSFGIQSITFNQSFPLYLQNYQDLNPLPPLEPPKHIL